jgi:hypothetical protein
MAPDEVPRDRQAEAGARLARRATVEALEQARQLLGRNAM